MVIPVWRVAAWFRLSPAALDAAFVAGTGTLVAVAVATRAGRVRRGAEAVRAVGLVGLAREVVGAFHRMEHP